MQAEVLCAFGGIRQGTTVEHVPAQSMFPQPRPDDLTTAPACAPCNHGTQPDDDYFRMTLGLVEEREPSAAPEAIRPAITRGLARPQAAGLRAHFQGRLTIGVLPGQDDSRAVINPDSQRLNNVVGKHAVGAYYEMMREPLPPTYGTVVLPLRWLDRIPQGDRPQWEHIVGAALAGRTRVIGDGSIFRFGFNVAHDNRFGFAIAVRSILGATPGRRPPRQPLPP
jgi:hypothetical protein